MRNLILASSVLFCATIPAIAQAPSLAKTGGAIGGPVSFPIIGEPNTPYILLLDLMEMPTFIPAFGLQLDISANYAWFSLTTPTFSGMLDSNGVADAMTSLPNNPAIKDCIFSLQVVAGTGTYQSSNLVRITPQLPGTFESSIEDPSLPILGGGAIASSNGDVIFVGGSGPAALRYQSLTEQWSLDGATFGVGLLSQTTTLADGRVLFTGGLDLTSGQPSNAAAIYDPATQTTTNLTMGSARAGHGTSQMGNGLVLISGGLNSFDITDPLSLFSGILASTEFFNPATELFSMGPTMLEARALHTSTTMDNGQVLVAGGVSVLPIVNIPTVSLTAYVFNPNTNSFGLPTLLPGPRLLHTATSLDNGKVLLAGGLTIDLTAFLQSGNIADLIIGTRDDVLVYTPSVFFGSFASIPGMQVGRAGAAIAALPNGGALIAGGFELSIDLANGNIVADATDAADVFSSNPNTLSPTGSMSAARLFPVATPLPDGTVMVVGGGPLNAEIYQR